MAEEIMGKEIERVKSEEILDVYDMFRGRYKEENEKLKEDNEHMKQVLEQEKVLKKKLCERVSELYALNEGWMQGYSKAEERRAVTQAKFDRLKRKVGALEAGLSRERLKNKIMDERMRQALEAAVERCQPPPPVGCWGNLCSKLRRTRTRSQ